MQAVGGAWRGERTNGELVSEGVWMTLSYEGPKQSSAWVNPARQRESFAGDTHDLLGYWFGAEVRPLSWLRAGANGNVGDQIDFRNGGAGDIVNLGPFVDLQLGRHVELGIRHAFQRLEKDGSEVFHARVDEVEGVVNFSTRAFFRGLLQYRRTERDPVMNPGLERQLDEALFSQFLFSYKVNPLTVAFIGLTDDRAGFQDGTTMDRVRLTPRGRTLFFKLGYAWRP
jgi:hypothetical protein